MRWKLIAALTFAAAWSIGAADAQQAPAAPASAFAPIPTPTLTPDMLKVPTVAPETTKPELKSPTALQRNKPLHKDIGSYDLQFKAGQRGLEPTGRTGLDSGEMSNAASIEGEKQRRGFLGLKLSTPTN